MTHTSLVTEVLLQPAADAFLQVGVWVAVLVATFGMLQWRTGGAVTAWMRHHDRWGPAVGGLLGMTPGCGGAILVMPLAARGEVTFGTTVATLVATMGDSSFALLATRPRTGLALHALLLVTGVVAGVVVDRLGISPYDDAADAATASPTGRVAPAGVVRPAVAVGAAVAPVGLLSRPASHAIPVGLRAWWALVGVGMVLSVVVVFQVAEQAAVAAWFGGVDAYLVVGTAGTAVAVVSVAASGRWRGDDDACSIPAAQRTAADVLRGAARETAFVTTWVLVAFVAWAAVVRFAGFDPAGFPALGLVGVLVGAVVGLVPGCGIQIAFTGLYLQGAIPFSTLAANALSQDGDALFPLLARDRRSAVLATVVTTVPAVLVGTALLALGW